MYANVTLHAMSNATMDSSCATAENLPMEFLRIYFEENAFISIKKRLKIDETMNFGCTNLGRGVRGLDSRDRTFPFVPFTRFRDGSLDLAPPTPLLGERSLKKFIFHNFFFKNIKFLLTDRLSDCAQFGRDSHCPMACFLFAKQPQRRALDLRLRIAVDALWRFSFQNLDANSAASWPATMERCCSSAVVR